MNTLIIIAAFVLAIYVAVVIATNKQIPNSLSESVYYLPTKGQWLWTAVIAIIALCAIPPFVSKTIHAIQWLAFLACAALAFVAVCPLMGKPGNPRRRKRLVWCSHGCCHRLRGTLPDLRHRHESMVPVGVGALAGGLRVDHQRRQVAHGHVLG